MLQRYLETLEGVVSTPSSSPEPQLPLQGLSTWVGGRTGCNWPRTTYYQNTLPFYTWLAPQGGHPWKQPETSLPVKMATNYSHPANVRFYFIFPMFSLGLPMRLDLVNGTSTSVRCAETWKVTGQGPCPPPWCSESPASNITWSPLDDDKAHGQAMCHLSWHQANHQPCEWGHTRPLLRQHRRMTQIIHRAVLHSWLWRTLLPGES